MLHPPRSSRTFIIMLSQPVLSLFVGLPRGRMFRRTIDDKLNARYTAVEAMEMAMSVLSEEALDFWSDLSTLSISSRRSGSSIASSKEKEKENIMND
jgi:hypothetical protein